MTIDLFFIIFGILFIEISISIYYFTKLLNLNKNRKTDISNLKLSIFKNDIDKVKELNLIISEHTIFLEKDKAEFKVYIEDSVTKTTEEIIVTLKGTESFMGKLIGDLRGVLKDSRVLK